VATESLVNGAKTKVRAQVMASPKLDFPVSHFTHSIMNFSIFAIDHPHNALEEVYRTLRLGGIAVPLTLKRWAV